MRLTNKVVAKNQQVKRHLERQETEKLWTRYFKGNAFILFELAAGLKIKLYRTSKLTEYILFHEFEKAEVGFFERYLQQGDFVLDIGANIGFHTIHASNIIGKEGRVFAFEPVLDTFNHLKENIAINQMSNVIPANIGFSDKNEAAKINVSVNYNAWNTLAKRERMEKHEAGKFDATETIQLKKLDDWILLKTFGVEKISLVKIDVEGWEKYVILGGLNYFSKYAPAVMMELSDGNAFAAGYQCSEVYEMFNSLGYEWFRLADAGKKIIPFPKQISFFSENLIAVKRNSKPYERLIGQWKIA